MMDSLELKTAVEKVQPLRAVLLVKYKILACVVNI